MPPRGRSRPTSTKSDLSKTLVVGIIGTGKIADEEVDAILNDLYSSPDVEKVDVIVALTDDALGDGSWSAFEAVASNVKDGELTLSAVTNEKGSKDDVDLHKDAASRDKVTIIPMVDSAAVTVADELVKAARDGAQTLMVAFWVNEDDLENPEKDGGQYAAVETAAQGGVKSKNALDAMDGIFNERADILLGEDQGEDQGAPEPDAEPETPRRGRGRPRSSDAEPAAEAAADEKPPARRRGRPTNAEKAAREAAAVDQPELPAADEAQSTSTEGAGLFQMFAKEVARELAKELVEILNGDSDEKPPTRRSRRS